MTAACVIATGALSCLGQGRSAYRAAFDGEPARAALVEDAELREAGLLRPTAGRVWLEPSLAARFGADRAAQLLGSALEQALSELDVVRLGWRRERIGVAVGTSSGGMLSAERYFAGRASLAPPADMAVLARASTYFSPLTSVLDALELGDAASRRGPLSQVLAACASSTVAIGLGLRWLQRDACDVVLAGGYDALSVFVAAGFEALRATTASEPRPFRLGRDGMALGEGAGIVALVRAAEVRSAPAFAYVAGFGASTDAVHITAPDRTGAGLARAVKAALGDAGMLASACGLVSAHATATPFNDAMEARALAQVFADAPAPVVHPFKAQIGHTLGAAGALELLSAGDALRSGIAPAAAGQGELDPDAAVELLTLGERRELHGAVKLSAAFGGANAALILTREPPAPCARPRRQACVRAGVHVTAAELAALSEATGVPRDRLARLDALSRLGLAAVAALAEQVGRETLRGAGIVVGHGLATLDTNERFDAKKRVRTTSVEPRLFPSTSPNAIAGEVAIVYELTGPSFAVGAGLDGGTEALAAAVELIVAADADRVVVLAADDAGPIARALLADAGWSHRPLAEGAIALLLDAGAGGRPVEPGDLVADHDAAPIGHLALRSWLTT
jgi:3-oxoacyl-[acyl-carrier-protein] synthase-1/3-oxoacyl-[acyl-carrier-protein] synthase II